MVTKNQKTKNCGKFNSSKFLKWHSLFLIFFVLYSFKYLNFQAKNAWNYYLGCRVSWISLGLSKLSYRLRRWLSFSNLEAIGNLSWYPSKNAWVVVATTIRRRNTYCSDGLLLLPMLRDLDGLALWLLILRRFILRETLTPPKRATPRRFLSAMVS